MPPTIDPPAIRRNIDRAFVPRQPVGVAHLWGVGGSASRLWRQRRSDQSEVIRSVRHRNPTAATPTAVLLVVLNVRSLPLSLCILLDRRSSTARAATALARPPNAPRTLARLLLRDTCFLSPPRVVSSVVLSPVCPPD